MARESEKRCVFCGTELGMFRSTEVICGPTIQPSCKACAKEVEGLPDEEKFRRAMQLGLAGSPHLMEERLAFMAQADAARPACLRCGTKLTFRAALTLDNSPMRDGIFSSVFELVPACCPNCGKMEFYDPAYLSKNRQLAYLFNKDTGA